MSNIEEWHDFEVINDDVDAKSIFDGYKLFSQAFENLPKAELVKRGWMSSEDSEESLLPLFRDIASKQSKALYRKSVTSNDLLCSVWTLKISTDAKIRVATRDIPEFTEIDKGFLSYVASLSVDEEIIRALPDILAEQGIILIYERALPGMKLDGAVFKLESGHPVIGISFRFPRLDNFWFTLMHELSHIVLHSDLLDDNVIYDDLQTENDEVIELAANRLAKQSFVDRRVWRNCEPKYSKSDDVLIAFARQVGIHPTIIAGMLRNEENNYVIYSNIVNSMNVRELVFGDD